MKFIVDAQLPIKLCLLLTKLGADCIHTLNLPDKNKTADAAIALFANKEGRIVITKDNDFLQSHMLFAQPQKLILVSTGNTTNTALLVLFQKHFEFIKEALTQKHFIEITKEAIIVHES